MSVEHYECTISRVRHHEVSRGGNASGVPFLIAETKDGRSIKGSMMKPADGTSLVGLTFKLWGEWKQQKGNWPDAFEFSNHEPVFRKSIAGVAQFLSRYIKGLGPALSMRLVEKYGVDCLDVLRTDPEVAREVPGITADIVDAVRDYFDKNRDVDPVAYAALVDLFQSAGLKVHRKIIDKLMDHWGSDAPEVVRKNPYMMMAYPRMGWKTVDEFALKACQYRHDGVERQRAAIREALQSEAMDGHTQTGRVSLEILIHERYLGMKPSHEAWASGIYGRMFVPIYLDRPLDDPCEGMEDYEDVLAAMPEMMNSNVSFMLPDFEYAERRLADLIEGLIEAAPKLDFDLGSDRLSEDQKGGACVLRDNGFGIVSGPPGVGKTWTVTDIVGTFVKNGYRDILAVAPTGKAAKRFSELLGKALPGVGSLIPCLTIHKALMPVPSEDEPDVPSADAKAGRGRKAMQFMYGPDCKLPYRVVICDEASMVDVKIACNLFEAIEPGTIVIIVGDYNQLPSVQAGATLRDMMDSGVPAAKLTKILRSDGGGRIVKACHAIKDGKVPEPALKASLPTENWVHIECSDPEEIARIIVDRHKPTKTFKDLLWDFQVVTAQKSIEHIGTESLNKLLARKINPDAYREPPDAKPTIWNSSPFRIGDKVIRVTKNEMVDELSAFDPSAGFRCDWEWDGSEWTINETDIVNGDQGVVVDIVEGYRGNWVVVELVNPRKLVRLPLDECHLELAYAQTCHKSQGSGYPYVIVPVHEAFHFDDRKGSGIFCREWIYTALSRAEVMLVTVGRMSAIRLAIGRKTIHLRRTTLGLRLRAMRAAREANRQAIPETAAA